MTKGKSLSIGAAMKNRMGKQEEPAVKTAPVKPVPQVEQDDPLESFNTRLPRSLQRRLKVYTAQEGSKIQDVVQAALDDYIGKKESNLSRKRTCSQLIGAVLQSSRPPGRFDHGQAGKSLKSATFSVYSRSAR